ncbi:MULTISPECIES: fimbrial protein [unclassified Citrobacter]|uniref:fimbrial protein n=1 Tax=Citrobacter sp. Igbk 16 TaxID=2963958 RepID=UPI0023021504|nr:MULTISPECIES: fimbrial protein [unclassified Citrobacter]MDA8499181.1 fimbrial protein [Citrobacter sp. Igbk 17]MDA8517923.1 fimbrial protein [Citrobacter sp. Igbk 16]
MYKTTLATAFAVATMGSLSAQAVDIGLITFDGAVTDTTCTITTNDGFDTNDVYVPLPVVKKSDVEGTTIDKGVGEKEFELKLSNCPDGLTKASAVFTSQQFADLSNGTLKNNPVVSGHANNVNLALYNNASTDKTRINIGLADNNSQTADISTGEGTLAYRVAYVPSADWVKGTTDITSGSVSSTATFTMTYQ